MVEIPYRRGRVSKAERRRIRTDESSPLAAATDVIRKSNSNLQRSRQIPTEPSPPVRREVSPAARPAIGGPKIDGVCTTDRCPHCGKTGYVTLERIVVGSFSVRECHCKACGASWRTRQTSAR